MLLNKFICYLVIHTLLISNTFALSPQVTARDNQFIILPKGKIQNLIKQSNYNRKDFFTKISTFLLGHFEKDTDKLFLASKIKSFKNLNIRPQTKISPDGKSLNIHYQKYKVILNKFNKSNQSFYIGTHKISLREQDLKTIFNKIVKIITPFEKKSTFTNFFIPKVHAFGNIFPLLAACLVLCFILPIVGLSLVVESLNEKIDKVKSACKNRDENVPYLQSQTYKLFSKLIKEEETSIVNFTPGFDTSCLLMAIQLLQEKKVASLSKKKIVTTCKKLKDLNQCIDVYKKTVNSVKENSQDKTKEIPSKNKTDTLMESHQVIQT